MEIIISNNIKIGSLVKARLGFTSSEATPDFVSQGTEITLKFII